MSSRKLFIVLIWIVLVGTCNIGFSADYYWVGGSGNWSDLRHWSTSSGGSTLYNSVPSGADNVYFDGNSFDQNGQTVILDVAHVFCRNFDWTTASGNPELIGESDQTLHVFGSFMLTQAMSFNLLGDVSFGGDESGHQIDMAGSIFHRNLNFDGGIHSGWRLASDLVVDSLISCSGGDLNTNNFEIKAKYLDLDPTVSHTWSLMNSQIIISGNYLQGDKLIPSIRFGVYITIDPGNSVLQVTGNTAEVVLGGQKINQLVFTSQVGTGLLNGGYFEISELNYMNNGVIRGSNNSKIQNLILSAGHLYTFSNASFQIGNIITNATCTQPITLQSEDPTFPAIWQLNVPITLQYVYVQSIRLIGSPILADKSVDLGNNPGWNFSESLSSTFYWVGGTGSWSDPQHWSTTSGGMSGGCIPSPGDSAIFDSNSFSGTNDVVLLDLNDNLCGTMVWRNLTNSPHLDGPAEHRLVVFGSLFLHDNLSLDFKGDLYLEGQQQGLSISMAGKTCSGNIYKKGSGEYIQLDELSTLQNFYLNNGTWRTNDNNWEIGGFSSNTYLNRKIYFGSSQIDLQSNTSDTLLWLVNGNNLALDGGNSTLIFNNKPVRFKHSFDGNNVLSYYNVYIESNYSDLLFVRNTFQGTVEINHLRLKGSGEISGFYNFGLLDLSAGQTYRFGINGKYTFDTLHASGSCTAMINLGSNAEGKPAKLFSKLPQHIYYTSVQDIFISGGSAQYEAEHSIDLQGNQGWTFTNQEMSRNLFWVGGSGHWEESIHWSLSSGGPGGECIPTPLDNVFFDAKSFSLVNDSVTSDGSTGFVHFKDLTWYGPPVGSKIRIGNMYTYGSVNLLSPLKLELNTLHLDGSGQNVLDLKGNFIGKLLVEGKGLWRFASEFAFQEIRQGNGTIDFGDANGIIRYYYAFMADNGIVPAMLCNNAKIRLTGEEIAEGYSTMHFATDTFTLKPGNSTFEFSGLRTGITSGRSNLIRLKFNTVIFSTEDGTGSVGIPQVYIPDPIKKKWTFHKLSFAGDGVINGASETDSLLFASGHRYQMESTSNHRINDYWRIKGNQCAFIRLESTIPGIPSITEKKSGEILGDFIIMRDQDAIGGATFDAGLFSVDIGHSNSGWVFEDTTSRIYQGLLGDDRALCHNTSFVLNENNGLGAKTYRWNEVGGVPELIVKKPGTYRVEAYYSDYCILYDTIEVLDIPQFQVDLGGDQALCNGDSVFLDGTIPLPDIQYVWQHGPTVPQLTVDTSGQYILTATLMGCVSQDTINIQLLDIPDLNIDKMSQICEGDTLRLDVTLPGASYLWSDQSTASELNITQDGTYWIQLSSTGCSASDTFSVVFIPPPEINLPDTTIMCLGESVVFDATNPNATYLWTNGETGSSINVSPGSSAFYGVVVQVGSCSKEDSTFVMVNPLPDLDLPTDQFICLGDSIQIQALTQAQSILWSTGDTSKVVTIHQPGQYSVTVSNGACESLRVLSVNAINSEFKGLGSDTVICENEFFILDVTIPGGTYLWNTGAVTSTIHINSPGIYSVRVNDGTCILSDSILVELKDCSNFRMYVPNAFTPNGDGDNDYFNVFIPQQFQVRSFDMQIYNRWGNLVFQSKDPSVGWDGTFAGTILGTDMYVARINLGFVDDRGAGTILKNYDVLLIR